MGRWSAGVRRVGIGRAVGTTATLALLGLAPLAVTRGGLAQPGSGVLPARRPRPELERDGRAGRPGEPRARRLLRTRRAGDALPVGRWHDGSPRDGGGGRRRLRGGPGPRARGLPAAGRLLRHRDPGSGRGAPARRRQRAARDLHLAGGRHRRPIGFRTASTWRPPLALGSTLVVAWLASLAARASRWRPSGRTRRPPRPPASAPSAVKLPPWPCPRASPGWPAGSSPSTTSATTPSTRSALLDLRRRPRSPSSAAWGRSTARCWARPSSSSSRSSWPSAGSTLHLLIFGGLFILIVLLLPGGLVEATARLRRLARRRSPRSRIPRAGQGGRDRWSPRPRCPREVRGESLPGGGSSGIVCRAAGLDAAAPVAPTRDQISRGEHMRTSESFPALGAIPVGYGPEGIAVDGEARRGYVAVPAPTRWPCWTSTRAGSSPRCRSARSPSGWCWTGPAAGSSPPTPAPTWPRWSTPRR